VEEDGAAALRPWLVWGAVLVVVTLLLRAARGHIDVAHVVLVYLLVVLAGSASAGRAIGLTLAFLEFVLIDIVFQVPYDQLLVAKPLDWLVLGAFLVTATVTTSLLHRARTEADAAQRYYAALGVERARLAAEAARAEALREADRLKDILIASVSHDLRTPITTIHGLARMDAERGDERAAVIAEQAGRLDRMVADLLDLSRLRTGTLPVQLEPNTAEDLVGALARQVSGVLHGRQLATTLDLEAPALVGRFDFVQSLRILTNLVENALRYAPGDTPVELAVRRHGNMLVFTVADRGPGVAAADQERIFEPFYRPAHAPPDAGRAGLGLSIARRLAENQGGRLRYEPRPGSGSVFTLELPALDIDTDG
jgi:two-component system sensor histidine kinase KdpD